MRTALLVALLVLAVLTCIVACAGPGREGPGREPYYGGRWRRRRPWPTRAYYWHRRVWPLGRG